jgi:HEAT repeat protein
MNSNYQNLINDIENGSATDAFESAKEIAHNTISQRYINQLANITVKGIHIHNRKAAVYALSWIENNVFALDLFIDLLSSSDNHELVRGQAAEGIGIINPPKDHRSRKKAEEILIMGLRDLSPTVRFWSCYAAGQIKLKKAIPLLEELKRNDHSVCPGWWYISEEAEDAIEWICGRNGKERIPLHARKGHGDGL